MKKYYQDINTLRGAAAIGVLCYHYFYHYFHVYDISGGVKLFAIGKYGVELFFMISGFLILPLISKRPSIHLFLRERFFRLYPMYFFSVISTFLFLSLSNDKARGVDFYDLIKNILIFPSLLSGKYVDGSYWTLEIEWIFYFYASLAIFFIKCKINKELMIMLSLMLFVICRNKDLISLGGYYSYFYVGIFAYIIKTKTNCSKLMYCGLIIAVAESLLYAKYPIVTSLVMLLFLTVSLPEKTILPQSSLFDFLAKISYPLYLIHQNIGYVMINFIKKYMGLSFAYALTISFVIAGAYLMSSIYENKISKYLR